MNPNIPQTAESLGHRFRARDPRFVNDLLEVDDPNTLGAVASMWIEAEPHAWMLNEARRYLLRREHRLGHEIIVRRLIEIAVRENANSVLAAASVYVDEACRHGVTYRNGGPWDDRVPILSETPAKLRSPDVRKMNHRWRRHHRSANPDVWRLFSLPTRRYLQNQLWRTYRDIAKSDLDHESCNYVAASGDAIRLYRDEWFTSNVSLLDCRGLMRLAFLRHPALTWKTRRVRLADHETLENLITELQPEHVAFSELWRTAAGEQELLRISEEARSNLMRGWADQLRNRIH